jgi:hypothetical protein
MRAPFRYIIIVVMAACLSGCLADYSAKPVCRVENGKVIFKFDVRWNAEEKRQIALRFDLDTALISAAYKDINEITIDSVKWDIRKKNLYFIELSKPYDDKALPYLKKNDVLMIEESWIRREAYTLKPEVVYGTNLFVDEMAFAYKDSLATFTLNNHAKAKEVFLSGSFNEWSTRMTPMRRTDLGWQVTVRLVPGKYTYKYIADGRWINDPENNQREREDVRGMVSVVYCPNHVFQLAERKDAVRVAVTGNFLNWNREGIKMSKSGEKWILPVYLRDGTYAYKFIADRSWMTDPANPDIRLDSDGNSNSFLSIGEKHAFRLADNISAEKVILSGSFNNWSGNELLMNKTATGWELNYAIPPGNYEYKFIIDGIWTNDKENPYLMGTDENANSFIAINPNHTFTLENYQDAGNVIVTGSFNKWKTDSYRMLKRNGKWIFTCYLKPGKYLYKFIIDDKWILDPANELWEANEYGTNNSVLWVDQ